jgi:aubergine-like protein
MKTLIFCFTEALHKYREYNGGALPQRIVLYRDGVGEGDIHTVLTHEVENLKSHLNWMYGDQPYKMAFIVVTKRINTRLFLEGRNPPAGTVADDCITMPER